MTSEPEDDSPEDKRPPSRPNPVDSLEFIPAILLQLAEIAPNLGEDASNLENQLLYDIVQLKSGYVEEFSIGMDLKFYFKSGLKPRPESLPRPISNLYIDLVQRFQEKMNAAVTEYYKDKVITDEELDDACASLLEDVKDIKSMKQGKGPTVPS